MKKDELPPSWWPKDQIEVWHQHHENYVRNLRAKESVAPPPSPGLEVDTKQANLNAYLFAGGGDLGGARGSEASGIGHSVPVGVLGLGGEG
jgi:hypothetical protein